MFSVATVLCVLLATSHTHDLYLGYADRGSSLVYNKVHQENPAIWVRSNTFTVNCTDDKVINAIEVLDLRDDKLGEVYVKGGGIGDNHVTIELDSPSAFRGYNFWVTVYATKKDNFIYNHGKK